MSDRAENIMQGATIWRERNFAAASYGASPYCASFVRWCFERGLGKPLGLPIVTNVPYYRQKHIHVAPGAWFADSLAGDEVGPVVQSQRPGDLLFFQGTCTGPWPVGSITHVGIAIDHLDHMADAGSGGIVHFRSHRATFPGLLVEIRRPVALGHAFTDTSKRTAISIARGRAFGMVHGKHVRDMTVHLARLSGSAMSAMPSHLGTSALGMPGHAQGGGGGSGQGGAGISGGSAGGGGGGSGGPMRHAPLRPTPHVAAHSGAFHWDVTVNNHRVKPVRSVQAEISAAGQHFKLFGHDHKAHGYINGAEISGAIAVKLMLQNGTAHVWIDGKEVKPDEAHVEIIG